ncbi:MAG: ATP-binding protein [Clostridiales bacterium]|jgi:hypothetical protein|nr:ATP-binding protein [Clostridiales bacterium]
MEDLSLYILDIVQNSINASASLIEIHVQEDIENNKLILSIIDNGKGMAPQTVGKATDPFYTTRTTRKVGLGLSLLDAAAKASGGGVTVSSELGAGTGVRAEFEYNNIDRPPLGKIDDTITVLVACNPSIDFIYTHTTPKGSFTFDTREVRQKIGDLPIDYPDVINWIGGYIREGLNVICGGGSV